MCSAAASGEVMKTLFRSTDGRPLAAGEPVGTDREALRALVAEADLLGVDPDGGAWLLIRSTRELIEYLMLLDAEQADLEDMREDDEDTHDREHDFGSDIEDDGCDDQPRFDAPFYPSAKDERELRRAQKWIDRASRRGMPK